MKTVLLHVAIYVVNVFKSSSKLRIPFMASMHIKYFYTDKEQVGVINVSVRLTKNVSSKNWFWILLAKSFERADIYVTFDLIVNVCAWLRT